ncbi:hypothetical protein [Candidatus Entotheonella palauensis]|uniref:Uncharacterized protein n=1 Tax=Candidatus Entotheonella gemina TaxID=1429439 RepID=W4MB71_9BACT|nr:hypothetical protein [Candidatus Entotheonella palauensis]ETX06882.1 MAG: hypothetical protein ETSY2_14475 [Candidatus Entotheonella gemina]
MAWLSDPTAVRYRQQLPRRRWHRHLRDALKHRAPIHREAALPGLFEAHREIGKGRLTVPGDL